MKYSFPAVFKEDKEEKSVYNVVFPDLMGVVTDGKNFEEAMFMAKDVLKTMLSYDYIRNTKPTSLQQTQKNFPNDKVFIIEVEYDK